ncbi:hypothetical protein LR48_Vigan125s001400 [Vigna angularis]|uniref:Uncharacterized protein n=1 Tax=Phaseolus angularis TaxID=3914 RepID=A0A0L9T688_PHAAN|nr:hypothetical protein LR48_Vigan125s001400 [Vigna angularis]
MRLKISCVEFCTRGLIGVSSSEPWLANQAFQQQPPLCFQPYSEQQPWHMQQQLPDSYWHQYAEPELDEFQSVQPWQDQLCDQQQGIAASNFQEMTTQVSQIVVAINQLTRKAKEEKEATINEVPLGAASTMEFQADHNHNEVVGGLDQVCSELDIPNHVPEIQVDIIAFDLLQLEPIKPILDLDTVVWMSTHTHILDSAFSIELIDIPYAVLELCADFDIIPVGDSFIVGVHLAADLIDASEVIFEEPVQVDFKFELPICLGEVQTSFDNLMHEKPLLDILAVIPDCTEKLDEICVVEHIDISDDFYDVCIGMDNNFEDSFMDCVELTMDSIVITKEQPTQVLFNLEILVVLSEFPLQFSSFDCLCMWRKSNKLFLFPSFK